MNKTHKYKTAEIHRINNDRERKYNGYVRNGCNDKAKEEFERPAHLRYLSGGDKR